MWNKTYTSFGRSACLERQDISRHTGSHHHHAYPQPPRLEEQNGAMQGSQPQQRDRNDFGPQGNHPVFAEAPDIRSQVFVRQQPVVGPRGTPEEQGSRQQQEGRGRQDGQENTYHSQYQ